MENMSTARRWQVLLIAIIAVSSVIAPLPTSIAYAVDATATETGAGNVTSADAAAKANTKNLTTATSCTGLWSSITNPGVCITRALFAGIASFLIFVGVKILTVCGKLFELVLQYTVISFKTPVYDAIAAAITAAWSAFRDISNILIIGFFTFIALSTILGSHEYGAKKLLARVLIIAVLINFSLLFTKLVIDASNFMSVQFYSASLANVDKDGTSENNPGIAGTFIRYLGVTGVADSYAAIREKQEEQDNALYGLALGLLAFVFLIAVSLVFIYGSFLLISRAILFIFLLITSSLAFSTYLVPKLSDNYGWKKWWGALLSNALLAPVLMMMLWVTLTVSSSLSSGLTKNGGTIGDLVQNPSSTNDISALFSYLIILGLLYASFKLASSFSSGVIGFNFAALIPAFGIGMAASAAGFLGRQAIGRPALAYSERLGDKAKQTDNQFAKRMYDLGSQRLKGVATRDFNAMRTGIGTAIAGSAGRKVDDIVGKTLKGFEGTQKAYLKRVGDFASRTNASADQKKAGKEDAKSQLTRADVDAAYKAAGAENAARDQGAKHDSEKEVLEKLYEKHDSEMKGLRTTLAAAVEAAHRGDSGAAEEVKRLGDDIATRQEKHMIEIKNQSDKISEAKKASDNAASHVAKIDKDLTNVAKEAGYNKWAFKNTGDIANEAVKNSLSSYLYASGISQESRDKLANKAGKTATDDEEIHHITQKYGGMFKKLVDQSGGHDEPKAEKKADDHGAKGHEEKH